MEKRTSIEMDSDIYAAFLVDAFRCPRAGNFDRDFINEAFLHLFTADNLWADTHGHFEDYTSPDFMP